MSYRSLGDNFGYSCRAAGIKGRMILKVSDFTLALVLLAIALAMAVGALSFPPMPGQAFGPKLFPNIVAAGFAICALALIMRAVKSKTNLIMYSSLLQHLY